MVDGAQAPHTLLWLKPWVIAAGVAGAAGIVVLNFTAAQFGDSVTLACRHRRGRRPRHSRRGDIRSGEGRVERGSPDRANAKRARCDPGAPGRHRRFGHGRNHHRGRVPAHRAVQSCRRAGVSLPPRRALGGRLERFLPARFRAAHHGHVEQFGRTGVTSRRMGDATSYGRCAATARNFRSRPRYRKRPKANGVSLP